MGKSQGTEPDIGTLSALAERCRQGDHSAFRTLMESQQHYAYAIAYRLLYQEDNARDIVQEAFIRVWNNFHRYRRDVKFTTWLYTIVVNLCYDKIKSDRRRNLLIHPWRNTSGNDDMAGVNRIHEDVESKDLLDHIVAQARKLPPKEYLVFHLRDIQDHSIGEVAEITGMSENSVKANLSYARKRIRAALNTIQAERKP